jgi:hypothetical protein
MYEKKRKPERKLSNSIGIQKIVYEAITVESNSFWINFGPAISDHSPNQISRKMWRQLIIAICVCSYRNLSADASQIYGLASRFRGWGSRAKAKMCQDIVTQRHRSADASRIYGLASRFRSWGGRAKKSLRIYRDPVRSGVSSRTKKNVGEADRGPWLPPS